jgi:hypothetical protein
MALHTDTLVVAVQDRYENTDQPLDAIGAEFGISGRTVSRMANEHGWKKRSERVRNLPTAMQLLEEAKGLATNSQEAPPKPEETPTLTLPLSGGGNLSAKDRLEALVIQQIEAEEIKRSLYAGKRRAKTTDDRCARTLATLTQTLHTLQRLRAGENPEHESGNDDFDDRPRDINEFRRDLARRIEAFVASRTDGGDAGGDAGLKPMDGAG